MKTLKIFVLTLLFFTIMGFSSLLSNNKEQLIKKTPIILELKIDNISIDDFTSSINKAEKSLHDRYVLISSLEAKIKRQEYTKLDSIVIR